MGILAVSIGKTAVMPVAIFYCSFGVGRQGFGVGQAREREAGCNVVCSHTT